MYVGTQGQADPGHLRAEPRLYPSPHAGVDAGAPPQKLMRIAHEEHEMNWVEAIKGQAEISSPFEYAARLTEVMLLGIVALRAGQKIHYDGAKMQITNSVAIERSAARRRAAAAPRSTGQGFGMADTKTL